MKKINSSLLLLSLLIILSAIVRVIPNRPLGFAPQIAIALFAGSIIKNKNWSFAIPLFSMFFSDLIFQFLYAFGKSNTPGFYEGQWANYLLIVSITFIGFKINSKSIKSIGIGTFTAAIVYFLLSNGIVWLTNTGLGRSLNMNGLLQTYNDGLPFLKGSIASALLFSALFFGIFNLIVSKKLVLINSK